MKDGIPALVLFFMVILISFAGADSTCINSGGGSESAITPTIYTESCFYGVPILTGVVCGDSNIGAGETCDDGNVANGDGCSSTCQTEETTTTTTGGAASGGGGGGGSTSGTPVNADDLVIIPSEISATVIQGEEETRELTMRNIGSSTLVVSLAVVGGEIKDVLVLSEDSFVISPNGIKVIELTINDSSDELLVGNIAVVYSGKAKNIPVVIGTKTENFLFDTSVFLSDAFKKMIPGSVLTAQFNLKEVNANEKVDVVANYVIKDFEGNKYYEDSETYFVQGEKEYTKEFPTETLRDGKYVLGFEVTYPGAFAISSATFDIQSPAVNFRYGIMALVLAVAIVVIIVATWLVRKSRFRKKFGKDKIRKI